MNLLDIFRKIAVSFNNLSPSHSLKILGIRKDENLDISLTYQLCGKNITNTETVKQLVSGIIKESGFSQHDQGLITDLYQEQCLSPTLIVTKIIFDSGDILANLYDTYDKQYSIICVGDIAINNDLKRQLSKDDLEKILQLNNILEQKIYIGARNKMRTNQTAKLYRVK